MILSIHIADVGPGKGASALARPPRPGSTAGLRYATTTVTARLGSRLLPAPTLGRIGLISAWESNQDLDEFLAGGPLGESLAGGFHARMRAVHVYGSFAPLDGLLADGEPDIADDEPAAVLTIGRLRLSQAFRFLRASAGAEALAVASPGMIAATGLARPPHLVATFSLWRGRRAMRAYAGGEEGSGHRDAVRAHAARPFHHESAFIRLRPFLIEGSLDGNEPLEGQPAAVA